MRWSRSTTRRGEQTYNLITDRFENWKNWAVLGQEASAVGNQIYTRHGAGDAGTQGHINVPELNFIQEELATVVASPSTGQTVQFTPNVERIRGFNVTYTRIPRRQRCQRGSLTGERVLGCDRPA